MSAAELALARIAALIERSTDELLDETEAARLLHMPEDKFRRSKVRARLIADGAQAYPLPSETGGDSKHPRYLWSKHSLLALPARRCAGVAAVKAVAQ